MLENQGVIKKLKQAEKVLCSPLLFLRKSNGKIRKSVYFRVLNSYTEAWVSSHTNVQEVLGSIPKK